MPIRGLPKSFVSMRSEKSYPLRTAASDLDVSTASWEYETIAYGTLGRQCVQSPRAVRKIDVVTWDAITFGKTVLALRTWVGSRSSNTHFDPLRPLVFMHIPKTGGSALIAALRERYTMTLGLDRTLFGDFIDFESMDSTIRQLVHFSAETLPIADVVVGHMAYSTLRQRFANAQFITVLREPFSRLLSHWLFWRGQTDENLASWGSWADRVRLARKPLAAFLSEQSLVCQLDNLVVRMLLGPHELIPVDNVIAVRHGRKLLSEARRSLAAFALVGLFENPRLSSDLRRWFGQDFVLGRHNETGRIPELLRRPLAEELTQEAVDLLSARSWLDLELWKDVARRCLPAPDVTHVRDRTVLRNIARYATLMSA